MKRFSKVVEDILLGKYGIAWSNNAEGYAVIYTSRICPGMEIEYYIQRESLYPDAISIYELFGVLEYERQLRVKVCNSEPVKICLRFSSCKKCVYGRDELIQ